MVSSEKDDISRGHDVILHSILGKTMQDVKHLSVFPPPHMGNGAMIVPRRLVFQLLFSRGELKVFRGEQGESAKSSSNHPLFLNIQPPFSTCRSAISNKSCKTCRRWEFSIALFQPISMKQKFARVNDGHQTHQQLIITADCLCCRFYLGIKKKTCNEPNLRKRRPATCKDYFQIERTA